MIDFKIAKPEGIVYEGEVERITIPTLSGEITVLENHAPLVSVLDTGEMIVHVSNKETVSISISGGILEIRPDSKVYIMADSAEKSEEIDIERAEEAKNRAQEMLEKEKNLADVDFARLQAIIEKEMNRIHIAKKYRK
ncbi:MAG: F0F1 ATP synthase subunit epsilon [uncultured bacterium]|nr:MAG: F0F1 ATP synthase subunit epsilon [uncultured bacterium]OGH91682.1 MAG: ATP synthase F1 subunit epsilon [Candidatus Magasanikbacteria bacterium RIFOXYD12_FULL_33_17]